jgi:hypothetical protein
MDEGVSTNSRQGPSSLQTSPHSPDSPDPYAKSHSSRSSMDLPVRVMSHQSPDRSQFFDTVECVERGNNGTHVNESRDVLEKSKSGLLGVSNKLMDDLNEDNTNDGPLLKSIGDQGDGGKSQLCHYCRNILDNWSKWTKWIKWIKSEEARSVESEEARSVESEEARSVESEEARSVESEEVHSVDNFYFPHHEDMFDLEKSALSSCALCYQFWKSLPDDEIGEFRNEVYKHGLHQYEATGVEVILDDFPRGGDLYERLTLRLTFRRVRGSTPLSHGLHRGYIIFEVDMLAASPGKSKSILCNRQCASTYLH